MKSDVIYEINDLLDRFKEKFPGKFQKKWNELIKEYNKENATNSFGHSIIHLKSCRVKFQTHHMTDFLILDYIKK